jgi:hypothetical protein
MTRDSLARRIAVGLLVLAWQYGLPTTAPAAPTPLTAEERATLRQYARDTWRSFEKLAFPSGLPADSLPRRGEGWSDPVLRTSPSNIGAYLWSILAAERLHLIGPAEAASRLERTLATLAGMERTHGFFVNNLDPRTGSRLRISPWDARPIRHRLSAVDNAWLAVGLTMVANTEPVLRDRARQLLEPMDFRFFYDPYDPKDPTGHPGQLRVGFWVPDRTYYGHYGLLNTEARIISYLAIARGQLPPEHYYHIFRTLPEALPQEQPPRGQTREYHGVKVFEGSYEYRGARIVPSWGGSMFEALMVPLFVPEDVWAPQSWGINHPLYVEAQIAHGLEDAGYGYWGFSPAASPRGGYQVYGVNALGTYSDGYPSCEVGPPLPAAPASLATPSGHGTRLGHGVATPYASFLALRYAPHEAVANLRALSKEFPVYSPLGFLDSVDVSSGVAADSILAVDQGMILAAIANELADDAMQHAFSDGAIEHAIRPLIAEEAFSAGTPRPTLVVQPAGADLPERGTRRPRGERAGERLSRPPANSGFSR